MSEATTVERFRALHAGAELLVLPNVWDVLSARAVEEAGAAALATSSAVLAWSAGYPDGQRLPLDDLLRAVRAMRRATRLPLSVDFERGYSDDPSAAAAAVARLVEAGAVGINIEDAAAEPSLLVSKIRAIRAAVGAAVFVNARTCVVLRGAVQGDALLPDLIARARAYADAGADGFFVPKLADEASIEAVARASPLPLNVMLVPGLPDAARLRALGARRLSVGPQLGLHVAAATRELARGLVARGEAARLLDAGLTYADVNPWFARQA